MNQEQHQYAGSEGCVTTLPKKKLTTKALLGKLDQFNGASLISRAPLFIVKQHSLKTDRVNVNKQGPLFGAAMFSLRPRILLIAGSLANSFWLE